MTLNVNVNMVDIANVQIGLPRGNGRKLSVRALNCSRLIAADINYDFMKVGTDASFARWEDSYSIGVRFNDEIADILVDGKNYREPRRCNETHILYLSGVEQIDFSSSRHTQEVLLQRSFMREIADDLEVSQAGDLGRSAFHVTDDPILRRLALRIYPLFDEPESVEPLMADHFMWALGIYVCAYFGGMTTKKPVVGGLSTWQSRLAKDVIELSLVGGIGLTELASLCGLRTSQFAHGFKTSTGLAPYQWLMHRRVVNAQEMLRHSSEGVADIALSCGFSDESHLIRNFQRHFGTSPARWRRAIQ